MKNKKLKRGFYMWNGCWWLHFFDGRRFFFFDEESMMWRETFLPTKVEIELGKFEYIKGL